MAYCIEETLLKKMSALKIIKKNPYNINLLTTTKNKATIITVALSKPILSTIAPPKTGPSIALKVQ